MGIINAQGGSSMLWLMYALMTVAFWGLYGIFLHSGQIGMADPIDGRYKAYLFVGLAYFLTAVLAPLAVLILRKASLSFPARGISLSLIAGLVGAAGAFCVTGPAPRTRSAASPRPTATRCRWWSSRPASGAA